MNYELNTEAVNDLPLNEESTLVEETAPDVEMVPLADVKAVQASIDNARLDAADISYFEMNVDHARKRMSGAYNQLISALKNELIYKTNRIETLEAEIKILRQMAKVASVY